MSTSTCTTSGPPPAGAFPSIAYPTTLTRALSILASVAMAETKRSVSARFSFRSALGPTTVA